MARYTHVVFDIDGTLVDTQYAVMNGLKDTMKVLTGRDYEMGELMFAFGIPGETTLSMLGIEDTKAGILEWNVQLRKYRDRVGLFEGVEALMEALEGVNIGIVTSKAVFEYEEEPSMALVRPHVGTAICADHTDKHKPEPDPLLKYMELTGAKKDEILYIGDSKYDEMCAHSAGVDFALATWGAVNKELPAEWKPAKPIDLAKIVLG